ncbi:MAG: hypothetical protein GOP50_00415 [Candidatus Heimdallarchaeota archaeon]|nr:hypothetical protein [Candidatus Heimdallarchaeota archaeon]
MSTKSLEFEFIPYEPIFSNLKETYNQYSRLYNDFTKAGEENVAFKVLSYHYAGMLYVIKGDELNTKKKYDEALKSYEEGLKLINRSRASRGREGDRIFNEMVLWINYCEGMQRICQSYIEEDTSRKLSLLEESVTFHNNFYETRKINDDSISVIAAEARSCYTQYIHNLFSSELHSDNTKQAKKYLLKARTEIMKANFIYNSLNEELEEIHNKIDEITKSHIVARAEKYWDQGTTHITESNFNEAQRDFAIASKYYIRASAICANFMEQRLYLALSRITEASQYEAEANEMYKRQDKPKEASELFNQAVDIIDIALGLLTSIKSESLINNMTAQRSFYEALAFETEGIFLFDSEQFDEALIFFEDSMKKLEETQISASEGNIDQLLEFVRTAKSEVEGYISMVRAMI